MISDSTALTFATTDTLPKAPGDQPAPYSFSTPPESSVYSAKILIVDDSQSAAMAVQRKLTKEGFTEITIENDACRAIGRVEVMRPDIVLLDIHMPVSGLTIIKTMRAEEHLRHIPVIAITSDTDTATKIRVLQLGGNDFLTKPPENSELIARVKNTLYGKIIYDELVHYSTRLESELLKDELTGVANRRAFDYELSRRMLEWERQRTPLAVLLIDVDHFKLFNDQFGHPLGDKILRTVVNEIAGNIRGVDLVSRFGGDELAIVLPGVQQIESQSIAERIRKSIEQLTIEHDDDVLRVQVSIGIANTVHGDTAESLVRRADAALLASKGSGRNRTMLHTGTKCVPATTVAAKAPVTVKATMRQRVQNRALGTIAQSRILVVDDEPTITHLVCKLLTDAGFPNVEPVNDGAAVFGLVKDNCPDLVLLDIQMPEISGMEIMQLIRADDDIFDTPVVFLTAASQLETKIRALDMGADDFLSKPVNGPELIARVRNTLLAKSQLDHLTQYSNRLEQEVNRRTVEVDASRREAFQCLARAAEIRDDMTGQHIIRVGRYAALIARELGFSEEHVRWLEHAAQLHDVGKIGVPDAILNKPGGLTTEEFDIMKSHCLVGSNIMKNSAIEVSAVHAHTNLGASIFSDCKSPILKMAAIVADSHHEKWDGTGYPNRLAGKNIPIEGRITAVADVFDALTTARPYKEAYTVEQSLDIICNSSGTHFDPEIVTAFLNCKSEILEVFKEYGQGTENAFPKPPAAVANGEEEKN